MKKVSFVSRVAKKLNKGEEFASIISWKLHKTSKSLVMGGFGCEDSSGPSIAQTHVSLSTVLLILQKTLRMKLYINCNKNIHK